MASSGASGQATHGVPVAGQVTQDYDTQGSQGPATPWTQDSSGPWNLPSVMPPDNPLTMRIPGTQETVTKEAYEFMLRDFEALKVSVLTQTRGM
jgi:hypothetical protein